MHPRVNILGTNVSAIDMNQTIETITDWLARRESHYVCVTPSHVVMDYRRDSSLRAAVNDSGMTTPDGKSIVWLLKLNGCRNVHRVYGADLLLAVSHLSEAKGWRQEYFLEHIPL